MKKKPFEGCIKTEKGFTDIGFFDNSRKDDERFIRLIKKIKRGNMRKSKALKTYRRRNSKTYFLLLFLCRIFMPEQKYFEKFVIGK